MNDGGCDDGGGDDHKHDEDDDETPHADSGDSSAYSTYSSVKVAPNARGWPGRCGKAFCKVTPIPNP